MARNLRYSLFWTVLNIFAFLLQQATVMAKHTCDTYQKHAKVTNVFSVPVDVSVSGVESQAGVRKATTCPPINAKNKNLQSSFPQYEVGRWKKIKTGRTDERYNSVAILQNAGKSFAGRLSRNLASFGLGNGLQAVFAGRQGSPRDRLKPGKAARKV